MEDLDYETSATSQFDPEHLYSCLSNKTVVKHYNVETRFDCLSVVQILI